MDAAIGFTGSPTAEDSAALDKLSDMLRGEDVAAEVNRNPPQPGEKELVGLSVGLSIAGLTVSALGTVISVLSYWHSSRPSYVIRVTRGTSTVTIGNLKADELHEVITQLRVEAEDEALQVRISRAAD